MTTVSSPDPRLAAAIAGDRDALASIAAELLPRVRNVVRYLVRGDGEVEDITQEALVAILRWLPSHRGEGTLRSWADKVTSRVAFAHLRKRRLTRDRIAAVDVEVVAGETLRPEDYATRRLAVSLLDQLPDEQRQVLVMHHVLGLSVLEIAAELEIPFETVRSRLRLGIGKLRLLHAEAVAS